MSSLIPETHWAQGASGAGNVYDSSPSGLGVSPSWLAPGAKAEATATGGGGGGLPSGTVISYAGTAVPAGWLACDGSAYDGTNPTYADLWAAIGTTYGGTGIASFQVPDLRGRMVAGLGPNAAVSTPGANDGQAAANRRPQHRTTKNLGISDPGHDHSGVIHGKSGGGSDGHFRPMMAEVTTYFDSEAGVISVGTTGVSISGSIGTNNTNDALDAPSYIVLLYLISL